MHIDPVNFPNTNNKQSRENQNETDILECGPGLTVQLARTPTQF